MPSPIPILEIACATCSSSAWNICRIYPDLSSDQIRTELSSSEEFRTTIREPGGGGGGCVLKDGGPGPEARGPVATNGINSKGTSLR